MKSKLIIAGGSGFLGNVLIERFKNTYTQIIVLTRGKSYRTENISFVKWDAKTLGAWTHELEGSSVIINLVGKSVNCRYIEKNKNEIIASRINATSIIGKAIQQCARPPALWINAGSAAIFGNSGSEIKDEDSLTGNGFSPEVCKQWEKVFIQADVTQTRKVFLRIGLVLQQSKGLLQPFIKLTRFGFGGKFGSGEQYISWIHEKDFGNIIDWVITQEDVKGILHCSSPQPSTNKEFMKAIQVACQFPFALPNPAFLIRIGAIFIGTEAELVLSGRRVVSKILAKREFDFCYPTLDAALKELIS